MITIKTKEEIAIMREGGKKLAKIMETLKEVVAPGITAQALDKLAEELVLKTGSICSFKNYQGFPNCLCVSINDEIVHGVPSSQALKQGDIVSLDLGLISNGFHADMAITMGIGDIEPETRRLIRITKKVLKLAIKKSKIGNTIGDIGNTIERYSKSEGFGVVRKLCGHSIGRQLHEDPQIPNFGLPNQGPVLQEGMTLALEPMVNAGGWRTQVKEDNWTVVTADGSLSAHFEHTIAISADGAEVLTSR